MRKLKGLYLLFVILFIGFTYLFIDPNLIYFGFLYTNFAFDHRFFVSILYTIFIFLSFIFYYVFIKKIKKEKSISDLKTLIFISIGLSAAYPAFVSYDIFNYIATAKVLFFYHENPYIIMPIEFLGDNLLLFTHAANKIALYGPVWILLTGIPFFATSWNFVLMLFSFKLFVGMFYLGLTYLIWKSTKDIVAVAIFALNPLILAETLASGHNDVVMMFFALLSYFLVQKKKFGLSIVCFIASIFIKYATIFLIPVFVWVIFKNLKKEKINWEKIYIFSFLSMLAIFFLSPLREEIYPWYAIWFLTFLPYLYHKKNIYYFCLIMSIILPLRYIPYMLLATHFGIVPSIKIAITFTPLVLFITYSVINEFKGKKL